METINKRAIRKEEKSIYLITQIAIWIFNFLLVLNLLVLKLF